jgi:hypothetical protein
VALHNRPALKELAIEAPKGNKALRLAIRFHAPKFEAWVLKRRGSS